MDRPVSLLNSFLTGVRVLDLSLYLPGPLASLFLADLGAEVLKIEPPDGDPMAGLGPRDAAGQGVFYQAINAGKASLRLDLKDPADHACFLEFVRDADILIEGFRPGVMTRLGASYEQLSAVNPRLVYCSLSGHGAEGPLARTAGHDANYLAEMGILDRNGDRDPTFFDPPVADTSAGLFAVISVLAALRNRDRTGAGCHLDIGLADVVMPLQLFPLAAFGLSGESPARRSYYLNGGSACYQAYRLRDGRHVMLGAIEGKFWRGFCALAGHPEWIDRQWDQGAQPDLIGEVAAFFATLTQEDCDRRFDKADICLSPVRDLGEALASPHVVQRALVRRSEDGEVQALFPVLVDGVAPASRPPVAALDPDQVRALLPRSPAGQRV